MSYNAKILADSVNESGDRLTTMEITFPRFVLAEFNTHRMFSRNGASNRAIPTEKIIQKIEDDPVIPVYWGKNKSGMQAREELSEEEKEKALNNWLSLLKESLQAARNFNELKVHKQIANRSLEPFMWMTMIVSSTDWENFFNLRCAPLPSGIDNKSKMFDSDFPAQPEIQVIAYMMKEVYNNNTPEKLENEDWHLPLIDFDKEAGSFILDSITFSDIIKVSAGRCARVSYLTHDGKRDPKEDIRLHDDLIKNKHWSPLEHQAYAMPKIKSGNFTGWVQYRKLAGG